MVYRFAVSIVSIDTANLYTMPLMALIILVTKVSKKAKVNNRYNQLPHLTQDTKWESDKNIRNHHIEESQEVSPNQQVDTRLQ